MRKFLFTALCLVIQVSLYAQSGTYILSRYTANAYWNESVFPTPANGKAYVYPRADTNANSWTNLILSVFKYSPADYDGHCMDSLVNTSPLLSQVELNTTFNAYYNSNVNSGFKQLNPVHYYTFQLHGKEDTAYIIKSPQFGTPSASDTEICFFIVPGSGDNQTSAIVRNEGYHVTNCNMMNTLRKHGDVYTFTKPNEDFRAIQINPLPTKKMVTDLSPTDSYLNQFLISNSRHEGINYLIECVAAIKLLKQQYKKVFLLGLSQGGYAGLYAALESEVDAVLISSGYSVKLDDNYLQFGNMAQKFAQLPFHLVKDSVKRNIAGQKTKYYFSWPINDSPIYQQENQFHYTQNYFSLAPSLNNVKYLYTYNNHAYPPCVYIDSFVNEVKFLPKAFVENPLNNCAIDSMIRPISFTGQAPFSFDLYRNDTLAGSYAGVGNQSSITLFDEGQYQIKNILDSNGQQGIWSDKFTFTKTAPRSFQIEESNFDCDSLKTTVRLHITGTPPFTISTLKKDSSGILIVQNTQQINDTICETQLNNGFYLFSAQDQTSCETLHDSILISDSAARYTFINRQYDCNTHTCRFAFHLEGRSPYTIHYFKNGIPITQIETIQNVEWSLDNGLYYFTEMVDSNNCHYPINQIVDIQYDSIFANVSIPVYDCESNLNALTFQAGGNKPFALNYLYNGFNQILQFEQDTTLFFPDGDVLPQQMSDATGCIYSFNLNQMHFNYDTFSVEIEPAIFNCDSNKSMIHFDFLGNPPYTITYLENGSPKQLNIQDTSFDLYLPNGNHVLNKVSDSMGCEQLFNQAYFFNYQPLLAGIVQEEYDCDSNKYAVRFHCTGNPPWFLVYSDISNTFVDTFYQQDYTLWLANGNWTIDSMTNTNGCHQPINKVLNLNFLPLQVNIAPTVYDCDSNKVSVSFQLNGNPPWLIQFSENSVSTTNYSVSTFDPNYQLMLTQGNWSIASVTDSTNCEQIIGQTILNLFEPLTYQRADSVYDCDSNKLRLSCQFTGDGPWILHYKDLNSTLDYSLQSNMSSLVFYLPNGNYRIVSVEDTKCSLMTDDSIYINYTALQFTVSPMQIDCDSAKYFIDFIGHGGVAPYAFEYTMNGMPVTLFSASDSLRHYLTNGVYTLQKVRDSLGCEIPFNQFLNPDYQPFDFDTITTNYLCDKDSTLCSVQINHQTPLWMVFQKNGNTDDTLRIDQQSDFLLTNGTYNFKYVYDTLGCSQAINEQLQIQHVPVDISNLITTRDCIYKEYLFNATLQGQSPWQLTYNLNNQPHSILIQQDTFFWKVSPGAYYLISIEDSTGCVKSIGSNQVLSEFLSQDPQLSYVKNELIAMPEGYTYYWYKNDTLIETTNTNTLPTKGKGLYHVVILDHAACTFMSNKINISYDQSVQLFPSPANSEIMILINEPFGAQWDYALFDMHGNKLRAGSEKRPSLKLDLASLEAGIYNLLIVFDGESGKHMIRFVKN